MIKITVLVIKKKIHMTFLIIAQVKSGRRKIVYPTNPGRSFAKP